MKIPAPARSMFRTNRSPTSSGVPINVSSLASVSSASNTSPPPRASMKPRSDFDVVYPGGISICGGITRQRSAKYFTCGRASSFAFLVSSAR